MSKNPTDFIFEQTKPEKRKKKRKGHRVDLKKFLKAKTIKNAKKDQYIADLDANLEALEREIRRFYTGKGKSKLFKSQADIVELFTHHKFHKYLCKVLKERAKEKDTEIPYGILFAISEMYVNNVKAFVKDEELSARYMKAFNAFYDSKIKKLAKKMKIQKVEALSLYLCSISFKDVKYRTLFRRLETFFKSLANIDNLDEKKVKIAIKKCYGKRIGFVLSGALFEKPQSTESFSIITNAILSIMENMDKDDLKDTLKRYAKRRRNEPKIARRLDLTKIDDEDYKQIHKVISKLEDLGFKHELFM